uniref:F-box domain-containing protein n=2 Tax=Chlamydomonas euryale TaxID=1486919 RepID=A0A7R9V4A0_9CHLO|mmetsp:Transcript_18771/g.55934  ORF Transcript_18771/g.55934 Transcript_18771/m.55934 type:complete len:444 (+) Transcript_18771:350-1681(+)
MQLNDDMWRSIASRVHGPRELAAMACASSALRSVAWAPDVAAPVLLRLPPSDSDTLRRMLACRDWLDVLQRMHALEATRDDRSTDSCGGACRGGVAWHRWCLAAVEMQQVPLIAWLYSGAMDNVGSDSAGSAPSPQPAATVAVPSPQLAAPSSSSATPSSGQPHAARDAPSALTMPSMSLLERRSRAARGMLPKARGGAAPLCTRLSNGRAAFGGNAPAPATPADVHHGGDAALRLACSLGHVSVVRCLLSAGADVHAHDGAPLALAAGSGHVELARMLIEEAGARVTAGGNKALSAAVASQSANALDALRLLLNFGADVHAVDNFALRWACLHNRLGVAELLLDRGANVHAAGEDALYQAAKGGHLAIVRLLLSRGANAAACPDAIPRAVERGHVEVAEALRSAARPRFSAALRRHAKNLCNVFLNMNGSSESKPASGGRSR